MQPRPRVGRDERATRSAAAVRNDALARRAEELAAQGAAFVTATVVRAQRPTSAHAGDVALVTSDGNDRGLRRRHLRRAQRPAVRLDGDEVRRADPAAHPSDGREDGRGAPGRKEDGAVTVLNTCLSGGAIEVFLEPTLPTPRVNVVGSKPIAARARAARAGVRPRHRRRRRRARRRCARATSRSSSPRTARASSRRCAPALEAELPYVGLVASPKRGAALVEELREAGVSEEQLARDRLPRRHRHRRPHAARGRAVDPRAAHRAPLQRRLHAAAARAERRGAADLRRRPDLRHDRHRWRRARCSSSTTARRSTSAREACKTEYAARAHGRGRARAAGTAKTAPATAVDPICGMTVLAAPGHAARRARRRDRVLLL